MGTNTNFSSAIVLLLGLFIWAPIATAQHTNFHSDFSFARYLIENRNFAHATSYIEKMNKTYVAEKIYTDSLQNISLQLFYFNTGSRFDVNSFQTTSVNNSIMAAYLFMKSGKHYEAKILLNDSLHLDLQPETYKILNTYNNLMQYPFAKENLFQINDLSKIEKYQTVHQNISPVLIEIVNYHQKRPILAAVFSSVIPGSGKLYTRRKGEALAAIFMNTMLGVVAWENYRKKGPESATFIVSATVFGVFYLGNIYGSYYSVKRDKEIRQKEWNEKISAELKPLIEPYIYK